MKRTNKRILTWMLVLAMMFSVFPSAALAVEDAEETGHPHEIDLEETTEVEEPAEEPAETPAAKEEIPAEEPPAEPEEEEPSGEPAEAPVEGTEKPAEDDLLAEEPAVGEKTAVEVEEINP